MQRRRVFRSTKDLFVHRPWEDDLATSTVPKGSSLIPIDHCGSDYRYVLDDGTLIEITSEMNDDERLKLEVFQELES